ncbi:MAG: rod shape-determining protein RodA [Bacteroidota bacterium]|nr:rod shape-determining protein RodA [Bacteroidota bacterium]
MSLKRNKGEYDWIIIGIYLSLLMIGWIAFYAVSYSQNIDKDFFNYDTPITKQSIYIVIALMCFFLALFVDWKFWHTFAYLIYGFSVFLLLLVLIIGAEVKGAKAWFLFGGFSFQPSEFAKIGTTLALSSMLCYYRTNLKQTNYQLISFGLILLPVVLILFQPDAGSAITFLSFFILLFIEGLNELYYLGGILFAAVFILSFLMPLNVILLSLIILAILLSWYYFKKFKYQLSFLIIILGITVGLLLYYPINISLIFISVTLLSGLIYLWRSRQERLAIIIPITVLLLYGFAYTSFFFFNRLEAHQQERLKVWLKPDECDPRGSLYNILQSKVAIGSGGFIGKGFLEGNMTKLKFVPEQSTDFIFSTIGEEHGFIGSVTVILLFAILIYRIFKISETTNQKFISYFAACLAGLLFIHVLVNIGMTMGLLPIIGIPLPFISKGGSSLITFSIMMGMLMRMQGKQN